MVMKNYKFNNHFAAAIGQLTSNQYNKDRRTPLKSKEICSSHPGHISDEDDRSLLWFNSGFRFCHEANNIDYQEETKNNVILKFLNGRHPLEFKKYYSDPLRITHAIVPPLNKNFQKCIIMMKNLLMDGHQNQIVTNTCGVHIRV